MSLLPRISLLERRTITLYFLPSPLDGYRSGATTTHLSYLDNSADIKLLLILWPESKLHINIRTLLFYRHW